MAAPCLRTKIDSGVQLLSALYVSVLLFSVGSVCDLRHSSSSHKTQGLGVYHFPDRYSSRFHDELSQQQIPQNKDILQLQQDVLSVFPSLADGLSQARNDVRNGLEIPHLRRKREVTQATVQKQVSENATGQLIDIAGELGDSISRTFVLVEASAHGDMFKVTELGKLELKKGYKLDYEDSTMRQITFTVDATSRTNTSDVTRVTTVLSLSNEDEPPVFITQPKPYMATISTDTGPGHVIIKLVAQDPEGRPVHYQKFSVQPSQIYDQRIELRTEIVNGVRECWLLTTGSDRFPAGGEIRVTVKARDDPNSGSEDTVMVLIKVGMMAPQFYQGSYEGSMHERNQPGQSVYKQGTLDELRVQIKTFQDGPVTMSLEKEGGGNSDLFSINNEGYIICNQELDYETINPKIQSLIVKASQRVGTTNQESQATLKVEIIDANDHTPTFDKSQYLHTMPEDSLPSSSVLSVTARDGDTGENARVVYSLLDSEPDAQFFQISTESVSSTVYTGVIRVKKRLDYDRKEGPYYNFQVVATDNGNPASSSITSVRVTVTNVNDEHPQFINIDEDDIIVMETAPTGQYITQVQATDKDGDQVTYSISSIVPATSGATAFNIDRSTGVITLGREIRPADDRFTVTIMAQDDGSCCQGSTTLTNTTQIFVQVSGENQNKPNFDNCNGYSVNIPEHSEIGFSVQTVSASDPDRGPNGRVTYEITAPKDIFTINPTTGLISVSQDIDREALTDPFKQVTLRATDNGNPPLAAWCTFRVTITDINDHKPTFGVTHYMTNITMDLRPKVPFLTITARDQDVGKNARINYSLVDDGNGKFGIIPENGFIFLESALTETVCWH